MEGKEVATEEFGDGMESWLGGKAAAGRGFEEGELEGASFCLPSFGSFFLEIKFAGVSEEVVREDEARGSGPFEVGGFGGGGGEKVEGEGVEILY